ncbi:MAG: hypothetical protein P3C12_06570 [Gemmatimonadota bacterium]|nr:hypothetical protein [Gemmatimonadota bacterium]
MTLLESIIASVLLAVTAVVCLDATRGAARLQQRTGAWTDAVSHAESALALASAGADATDSTAARITRRPWGDGAARLDVIEVEVPVAGGGAYRMARLVERAR